MNNIFEINRFANLEKQSFFLSKSQLLYIVCVLVSLYVLSSALYYYIDTSLIAIIFFVVKLIIVVSPSFLEKNVSKNNSVFDFILPVSTFERILSILVKYVIVIPIVCIGTLGVLNLLASVIPVDAINEHARFASLSNLLSFEQLYELIATQAVFILGNFYFQRHAFAKTCLVLLIGFVLISIIGSIMATILAVHADFNWGMNIDSELGAKYTSDTGIDDQLSSFKVVKIILGIIFPFGLWLVSYFKLRETEI